MGRVDGKVVFITGAARGMGRAEAVLFAEEGADVIAFDVCAPIEGRARIPASTPADLAETVRLVEGCGRRAVGVIGDTRRFDDVAGAVREGLAAFGRLDVVVANAGTSGGSALAQDISEDDWKTTIDTNLTGVWHTVKAVLPTMIGARSGSIVLISSSAGVRPLPHLADYGAAKAAVIHLGKILALENGAHGIRVNVVTPGTVDTPLVMNPMIFSQFRPDLEHPTREDVEPIFAGMKPLKGKPFMSPRDVANAVLWLGSDEASTVSGTVVAVDMAETIGGG